MKTYIVETVVGTLRKYRVEADSKKDVADTLMVYGHPKVQMLNYELIGTETITGIKRIKPESTGKGESVFANMKAQLTRERTEPDWWHNDGHP